MAGGLLQLVAYGAQDAYLSGNPQITFWKGLFKRHTNFAMEPFRINFNGGSQWGTKQTAIVARHADLMYSSYIEVTLPRIDSTTTAYLYNNDQGALGFNLLKYVELDIGGQIIDRQYAEFMYLWSILSNDTTKLEKTKSMLSGVCESAGGSSALRNGVGCGTTGRQRIPNVIYIPLNFFFCKTPGAALPLIALQYHEVKINLYWNDPEFIAGNFNNPASGGGSGTTYLPQISSAALYIDYIFLDTEERRRMAQASHEYLIEQLQYNEDKGIVASNNRIDLTFNHPVKELVWVCQPSRYRNCKLMTSTFPVVYTNVPAFTFSGTGSGAAYTVTITSSTTYVLTLTTRGAGYTFSGPNTSQLVITGPFIGGVANQNDINFTPADAVGTFGANIPTPNTLEINNRLLPFTYDQDPIFQQWIQFNGQDRLDYRYGNYFNKVQPYQHHTGSLTISPATQGVYCYSFALKPEEHQPSGTCNFSRIDTATIVMNFGDTGINPDTDTDWDVRVYATNYNILRIMSGMGGLAYSN